MSRINDWMMEMEEVFWEVYSPGISFNKLLRNIKGNVSIVDEKYIRQLYDEVEA